MLSRRLLGRVDLAIVLGDALQADAAYLKPRRIVVVPNGIPTPRAPDSVGAPQPYRLLFLGLCSEEKGLFAAAAAVQESNRLKLSSDVRPAFALTAAGPFDRR